MTSLGDAFKKAGFEKSTPTSINTTVNKKEKEISLKMPEDYVQEAENNMRKLGKPNNRNPEKLKFDITTSKIRNILSMVSEIYNEEIINYQAKLSTKSISKKQALQVRILYEAGRDQAVEKFIKGTKVLDYLKQIKDEREQFMKFAKYMEA